jgi:dihydroorotate dehydrogenase electron transfer subunit
VESTARVHLYDFIVTSKAELAGGIWRVVICSPELSRTLWAGQFINVDVPGDRSQLLRIPLSFASIDQMAGEIELVVATVGDGTRRLAAMAVGQGSTVVGPCGNGWRLPRSEEGRVLLVAGGVGIVPLLAAGRELAQKGIAFEAVIGARSASQLWGEQEFMDIGASSVLVCTDDGSKGFHGFTTQALQATDLTPFSLIMSCGPAPMMAGVAACAHKAHVSCQVSLEQMMSCGFGACHTCNVAMVAGGYKFCCTDGPVFNAEEVLW